MNSIRTNPMMKRLWDIAGGVSIRTKIMGIVLGGTVLLSLVLTLQVRYAMAQTLQEELQARGVSIGRDLAARSTDLILVNDLYALHQLLVETQHNNPDVRYAFVQDPQGQILAHTFGGGFPAGLVDINSAAAQDYQNTVPVQTDEGLIWDIAVPIFESKAGIARIGISNDSVNTVLLDLTSQLLITTSLVLVFSLLAATYLTFILTRPILELVDATKALGQGNFTLRVRRWAEDEIGELAEAFNQMTAQLKRTDDIRREREELRRQLLDGVIRAQEEERGRIARELHDSTSQNLTSLMVGLRNLDSQCDNPQVNNQARDLRNVVSRVLEDVHNLAIQLRPSVLDDLGLEAALERLIQDWRQRHRIPVDLVVHLREKRLSEAIETAIYRIVQEGLTNIARHSEASSVSVLVELRRNEVVTVIEDDGIGIHAKKGENGGLGLPGIRERAELLGGKLIVESAPDHGTSLYIQIPLQAERVESR